MKRIVQIACLLVPCALHGLPCAAAGQGGIAEVVVSGIKDPDWKTYRAFTAGLDTFDQQRQLAPDATLRFVLLPKKAKASLKDIKLRIAGDTLSIPVPIAADGTFAVPRSEAATRENADLLLNRQPGTFRWRPDVRTPGVPANARRLGDLRLECAVRWTVEEYETPYVIRKLMYAAGQPCLTARIKVDYFAPRAIVAMYLKAGERRVQLPGDLLEEGGKVYVVPVHDAGWPDDTLVEFQYAAQDAMADGQR